MNKLLSKKILSLTIILTLVFSFTSAVGAAEEEKQITLSLNSAYSENLSLDSVYSLTPEQEELAEYINAQLKECKEEVDIEKYQLEYNEENLNLIRNILSGELPECFHISGNFAVSYGRYITSIVPQYEYTKSRYDTMLRECETKAEELLSGIKDNDSLTTEEKLLLIHDRIALNCMYDPTPNQADIPHISHTMYGVLGLGVAVCQGYALTYGYLLDQIGVKNYYCSSAELVHAWNIVYLNGTPYHVDVTFDDPVGVGAGRVYHNNFLVSTDTLRENGHNATDFDSTPTDTKYDNYFWQDIQTAFVLAGNDIYYLDNKDAKVKRKSDGQVIVSVEDRWMANSTHWWQGNFSLLATDGTDLIYNLSDAVYRYRLSTGKTRRIYSANNLNEGENIFGFAIEGNEMVIEVANHPDYGTATKVETIRVPYSPANPDKPDYTPGDINDDGKVDNKDIVILSQYMAGWEVYSNKSALDVNGDGERNLKDVIHLAKVVAEWEGFTAH